jgi:outer membrane biosynthesis protein TonB
MSPEERAKKCAASPARAPAELDPPGAQPNSDTQGTSGRINPDVIQRPILERKDCMAACFSDALERDASLQGTVAIFFTIGADGRVSAASVSRTEIGDSAFLGCVLDELRALTFPAPNRGSVTVTYPLRFG